MLDTRAMGLVMSSEFTKKQRFKLKKIERLIYIRKVDGFFQQEGTYWIYGRGKYLLLRI